MNNEKITIVLIFEKRFLPTAEKTITDIVVHCIRIARKRTKQFIEIFLRFSLVTMKK